MARRCQREGSHGSSGAAAEQAEEDLQQGEGEEGEADRALEREFMKVNWGPGVSSTNMNRNQGENEAFDLKDSQKMR